MGMAGFILSFVGYEWNGMDLEEGCMHHIIQKRKNGEVVCRFSNTFVCSFGA
jgi:hypothetical protein